MRGKHEHAMELLREYGIPVVVDRYGSRRVGTALTGWTSPMNAAWIVQKVLEAQVEVCEWQDRKVRVSGDRYFDTGCHYGLYPDMTCNEAMPWKFCPYCGKTIREVPYAEEASDSTATQ